MVCVGLRPRSLCAVDAHRSSLRGGALLRAIRSRRVGILPQDHCRTNLPLREVVLKVHIRVIQKRKDELAVLAKALGQAPGVGVEVILGRQIDQSDRGNVSDDAFPVCRRGRPPTPIARMSWPGARLVTSPGHTRLGIDRKHTLVSVPRSAAWIRPSVALLYTAADAICVGYRRTWQPAQVAYFNSFRPCPALQTADFLPGDVVARRGVRQGWTP